MSSSVRLLTGLVTLILLAGFVWAQTETGQIAGTVSDPSGAVVPNATVTLRNTATGLTRDMTSTDAGLYLFPSLLPGAYVVGATAPGFSIVQRQVTVTVGSKIGVDLRLAIGQSATIVEVSESAAQINTQTQTLETAIPTKQVLELPTLTRNPYALLAVAGNVSEDDPSARGAGFSINGQRASGTNVLLDGASNNNEFTGSIGQPVPLDSVQELSVITTNFTAEFGRATAGVVNVATKNGTNQFHGTAYEFNRVSRLAANSFDNNANGIPKPVFGRNQFGYSVGGPIKKDKIFFFQNTEWIRVRSAATRYAYVPAQGLIGAAAPATQNFFSTFGQFRQGLAPLVTYTKDQLQALGADPCKGAAVGGPCAQLPGATPMFTRVGYNYPSDSGGGLPQNTYELVGRVDYNKSEKTQIYGRYALYNRNAFAGTNVDSPYSGFDAGITNLASNYLASVTHSFTPVFVSQSKVVFNRLNERQPLGTRPVGPTLYIQGNSTAQLLGNNIALPGYSEFTPGNAIPYGGPQNFVQLYQDMSYTRGKHTIRFGGSYVYFRDNRTFGAYQEAVDALGLNLGNAMDNFLRGQLYSYQAAVYPQGKYPCGATVTPDCTLTLPVGQPNFSRSNRYNEAALYGQDTWRVTPRLTLNLGLRWEYYGVQHNKNPQLDSNFYLGGGSNIFQQIAAGQVYVAPNSPIGSLWNKHFRNFAPRLGFAWDVTGDGKTSLRGGYGMAYERNFGNVTFNVIQNPPNYAVISLISGVDVPVINLTTDNAGPLAGTSGTKALPKTSLRAVDPNIKPARVQFWSLSLEREVFRGVLMAAEYTGSRGADLYSISNINRPGQANVSLGVPCSPLVGNCNVRLDTTQYSNINFRTNGGESLYNAFNYRVQSRAIGHTGVTLRANYTYSHTLDNLSSTFTEGANFGNLGFLDPFRPGLDWGNAEFDNRHRLAVSAVWEVPFAKSAKGAKKLMGGWSLAPIFTARTGNAFSLFDCTNALSVCPRAMFNTAIAATGTGLTPAGTPNKWDYIDFTKAKADSTWVNPAFGVSDFGPFPANMTGRGAFRTPGNWNLDLGLYKTTKLTERFNLQLRGEFYNFFNHSNLYANEADLDVASYGFVSARRGVPNNSTLPAERRNVQLALKLIF